MNEFWEGELVRFIILTYLSIVTTLIRKWSQTEGHFLTQVVCYTGCTDKVDLCYRQPMPC